MQRGQGDDFRHTLARLAWYWVWLLLFLTTPRWGMNGWRRFLLRLFGARIGKGAIIRPSCRIWAPWNLSMGSLACLADDVDCCCVAPITLGNKVTVSQYSMLLTVSNDLEAPDQGITARPIVIGDHAWVASNAFIGPGVRLGPGAVVGACSMVLEDVASWSIVAGNPARFLKTRQQEKWRINPDAPKASPDPVFKHGERSSAEQPTRVGIVTFHFADNYGAVLQTYALQKALQEIGCDPRVVDYQPSYMISGGSFRWPASKKLLIANLRILYIKLGLLRSWFGGRSRDQAFRDFRQRYLHQTAGTYRTAAELQASPPGCDVYVCGSDQVWNATPRYGVDPVYYLDFAPATCRRVAYAASFGRATVDPDDWERTADQIRKLHSISVREKSGVILVNHACGRIAEWLPDPVLLHDDYSALIARPVVNEYVFAYSPSAQRAAHRLQQVVAAILRLPLIVPYDSRPYALLQMDAISLGPSEWLGYLAQSSIVVTNSYHGVLFSILFRKPFIAVALSGEKKSLNDRIESVLERLGLLEYMLTGNESEVEVRRVLQKTPDWDAVHAQVRAWRADAFRFLRENVRRTQ